MNHDETSGWNTEEARQLAALRVGPWPDAALEDRIVSTLRQAGLIAPPAPLVTRWATPALIAAATLIALLAIWRFLPDSSAVGPQPPPASPTAAFALLLYEDASYQVPTDMPQRIEEYVNWARGLEQMGIAVSGHKLGDRARLLEPGGVERPPVHAQIGPLVGFFVIEVAGEDAAVRLARTCPHLKYGGRIELRSIDG